MSQKTLTEETLQEIIRRVVEVAHPERIILFGSAARGEMDSNSDVDLLVIKDGDYEHGRKVVDPNWRREAIKRWLKLKLTMMVNSGVRGVSGRIFSLREKRWTN